MKRLDKVSEIVVRRIRVTDPTPERRVRLAVDYIGRKGGMRTTYLHLDPDAGAELASELRALVTVLMAERACAIEPA